MHPLLTAALGAFVVDAIVLYVLRMAGYRLAIRRVGIPE